MSDINQAIADVVGGIPSGVWFNAHYVIDQLIENHSDAYLTYALYDGRERHNRVDTQQDLYQGWSITGGRGTGGCVEYKHSRRAESLQLLEEVVGNLSGATAGSSSSALTYWCFGLP